MAPAAKSWWKSSETLPPLSPPILSAEPTGTEGRGFHIVAFDAESDLCNIGRHGSTCKGDNGVLHDELSHVASPYA
jgi:hypothetical protein